MNKRKSLNQIRLRRRLRARAKIFGTLSKPRLAVFRSNRYTYVQLIDDENGKTLFSVSTQEIKEVNPKSQGVNHKVLLAEELGELIAKKAITKGIKKAIFYRRGYKYHGRIKAVAEGARKGGLQI